MNAELLQENEKLTWKMWNSLPSFKQMRQVGITEFTHNVRVPLIRFTFNGEQIIIKHNPNQDYKYIISYKDHKTYVVFESDIQKVVESYLGVKFEPEFIGLGI